VKIDKNDECGTGDEEDEEDDPEAEKKAEILSETHEDW
jgi:hypothetical protein